MERILEKLFFKVFIFKPQGFMMKKLIFILCFIGAAKAETLMESCPSGFIAVNKPSVVIVNESCPSGYIATQNIESCIKSTSGICGLFADVGTSFEDESGTYVFDEVCVYE